MKTLIFSLCCVLSAAAAEGRLYERKPTLVETMQLGSLRASKKIPPVGTAMEYILHPLEKIENGWNAMAETSCSRIQDPSF